MLEQITKNWWVLLIQGILGVVFGILAWIWPGVTAVMLAIMFGAWVLIDGIMAIVGAIRGVPGASRGWLAFLGIISVIAGLMALFMPLVAVLALVLVIGIWAVAKGVTMVVGAIQLRKEISNEWFVGITGGLLVLFGALVLLWPGEGLLTMVWLIAFGAVVVGVMTIIAAFRLKGMGKDAAEYKDNLAGGFGTGGASPAPS